MLEPKMKETRQVSGTRIFLKALNPDHLSKDYMKWMRDKEILHFLAGAQEGYSAEELRGYVVKMNESPADCLFGIFLKSSGVHIGNIKIGGIDPQRGCAHVGLLIGRKDLWGQGYATEGIVLVTRYAFETLGLQKLTAGMTAENAGSYKAFKKNGYKDAGLRQEVGRQEESLDIILVERWNEKKNPQDDDPEKKFQDECKTI